MKKVHLSLFSILLCFSLLAQEFTRSELDTKLSTPWEIIYGPDNMLWISEYGGVVSRVNPKTGEKKTIYTATDFFAGDISEKSLLCFNPKIGNGTLGMALHPDFNTFPYIYLVYSHNFGTIAKPCTRFRIERLKWEVDYNQITEITVLVNGLPNGYDHLGGRLLSVKEDNKYFLYFTTGDNGISETNSPGCYNPASSNPNFAAQIPDSLNGKILRFNIDGTIPSDNPIPGNPFFTRGHRNPQGLAYNPQQKILYEIEHGDRSDDEINILEKGMNYGWKTIRGFHADNNYPGEAEAVASFSPDPRITGDALREPIFTWCSTPQPTITNNLDWCTVAPSDGFYYSSNAIKDWQNSILVVTLKNGPSTDMELYRVKLSEDGRSALKSTSEAPNPKRYFSEDQKLNGRLRDLTVSPDGKTIYLINNGGADRDKITVYTYTGALAPKPTAPEGFDIYPNPVNEILHIYSDNTIHSVLISDLYGKIIYKDYDGHKDINLAGLAEGVYYIHVKDVEGQELRRKLVR